MNRTKLRLFTLAMACCLAPVPFSCAQAPQANTPQIQVAAKQAQPRALWVWDAGVMTQPAKRQQFFDFCKDKNIEIAYIHLGDFLSPTKRDASDPKHVTAQVLGDFLEAAHARNLRVEALDGDPSFTRADKHEDALKRLKGALDYNKTASAARRLDGFQWDIEPYVMPEFKDEAQHGKIVGEFLDIIEKSRDAVKAQSDIASASGFWLGFALPFWMDGERQTVTWKGQTRPATFHALHILDSLPNSYVAFMAYRDKADGTGGTIAVVKDEMDYAAANTPNVKLVVGQETGAVKGEGPLETALAQINEAYANSPVYYGVAIHHLDSYRDLIARLPKNPVVVSGDVALTVETPANNAQVGNSTPVSGKASGGATVQLSIKPAGDIWYDSTPISIAADGTWKGSVRVGNDATPAGRKFTLRARLLDSAGKVLKEQQVEISRS
jgi:hypothetical protein